MNSSTRISYQDFSPPATTGTSRALVLALLVHALLLIALTAGIHWQHNLPPAVQAEIWSAVPVAAAPKAVEPEPEPEPEPAPPPPPPPPPAEVVKPAPPPAPTKDADIAIAKRKKLEEELKRKEEEAEKRRLEELKEAQAKKAKKLAEEKAAEEKRQLEAKREQARLEQARKDKELQKQKELKDKALANQKEQQDKDAQKKKEADDAKKLEALRKERLKRIAGLAGASGDANATGVALKSAGPSDSYGGRIQAVLYPKIVFSGDKTIPYAVDVEIQCAPNGTIVGTPRIDKRSANPAWDDAVIKAFIKLDTLPRDTDGRVHCPLIVTVNQKN